MLTFVDSAGSTGSGVTARAGDAPTISAREVQTTEEANVVCRALRHAMRWQDAGFAEAPGDDTLSKPATMSLPARCVRRVHSVLLFAADHLVGFGTDIGWGDDLDRTRIAELVLLDGNVDAYSVATALMSVLFVTALALRARVGGVLASHVASSPTLEAGGMSFHHVVRPAAVKPLPAARAAIDEVTSQRLGAFGSGVLDGAPGRPTAPPAARILDPSTAHAELIRGSRLLRRRYYPAAPEVADIDVAIVGGGIAGLTAAYALAPRRTILFEREASLGGTARAGVGLASRFPLGAHYECDPEPTFGAELLALYDNLGLVHRDALGRRTFVDAQYYVPPHAYEQSVLANGGTRRRGWRMFFADAAGVQARRTLLAVAERFPLPSRLSAPAARELDRATFASWLADHRIELPPDLMHGLDVLLRSDYAAPASAISAYAGLHYFLCRPYLRGGSRTFSPPEGLAYFGERLRQRTPGLEVALRYMVRRLVPASNHVLLEVLDLEARRLRAYRAQAVVYAAPKKALKWIHPVDAALFARNSYAAWLTVTLELDRFRESAQLCWNNHVYDARREHIGFTWVNHADPDAPPILTHYIAYEPGRWEHVRAFFADRREMVRRCLGHVAAIVGRDVASLVRAVTVQTLGHAMAVPLPGRLFFAPNTQRRSERVVYAGVDTGRLPLLAEAFDSGLEAARLIASA